MTSIYLPDSALSHRYQPFYFTFSVSNVFLKLNQKGSSTLYSCKTQFNPVYSVCYGSFLPLLKLWFSQHNVISLSIIYCFFDFECSNMVISLLAYRKLCIISALKAFSRLFAVHCTATNISITLKVLKMMKILIFIHQVANFSRKLNQNKEWKIIYSTRILL